MKKSSMRVISLLTVLCMLLISGCQGHGEAAAETPEEFWARPHDWQCDKHMNVGGASNDYGYYYVDDNWIFKYLDYTARQCVALCNKVGCKHDDYTCEAFIMGGSLNCFFREEKMYLIQIEDDGTHIYRCELDATNREDKILLMKDEMKKGNAASISEYVINGDDLYYEATYNEPTDEAGGEKKPPIHAIRHINMKKWTDEEVCRSREYVYELVGADDNGVLISKSPDYDMFTKVDLDSLENKESDELVILLTLDELKELPFDAIYWNKKTGGMLTVYQSNARDTAQIFMADGSFLYRMVRPETAQVMALNKINMQTGEAEWLWNEKNGKGSTLHGCAKNNGYIWLGAGAPDGSSGSEVYIPDGFKQVSLPFLKENAILSFVCEHGFAVSEFTEAENSESGSFYKEVFIPAEEIDKENPEYILISSYGN